MALVRYLVDDVEREVAFYTDHLGFTLERKMGPAFAIVNRGDLSLWLSGPGPGGKQIVLEDSAGNAVELLEPA